MSGEDGQGMFPSLKSDMDSFEMSELSQQVSAQVAMLACDLPRQALKEGSRLAAIALKPRVISKYEYNQNRVRDFRVCKDGDGAVGVGDVPDDEITASSFDPYPNAFTRAYCKSAFESGTLRLLHEKIWSFEFVRLIDVSELLIGDDGFMQLCDGLEKCPVHTLILTNNKITDKGLFRFADMWRSMSQLDTLKLANNKFTDRGVESMLHPTRYSPSVRVLDLSKNRIGVRTAFYLGLMFVNERLAKLEDLTVGVRVGSLSHGDNFILVLVAFLTSPRARPLRKLDLSDSGIGDVGVAALASLAACSEGLTELYISRNYISPRLRSLLFRALVVNRSINVFRCYYCGFNGFEEERIKRLGHTNIEGVGGAISNVLSTANIPSNGSHGSGKAAALALKYQQKLSSSTKTCRRPTLSWVESIELCNLIIRTLNTATIQMRKVLEGVSRNDVPPPLPSNKMFSSDARGKLTVLQQISMYGRRSLKATPLRDELDALKYVTVRPIPVTFKKAMYLLGEIKKMTAISDLHSPGRVDDDAFSIMSVADSIEAGPQLYIKLVYGDIILLEKWLNYIQTVHMGRNVAMSTAPDETKRHSENYNKRCAAVLIKLDVIRRFANEMVKTDSVVDILMEQANKHSQVTQPAVNDDGEFVDQNDDDISQNSAGVSSLGDNSVTARAMAPIPANTEYIASRAQSPVPMARTARTAHTGDSEGNTTIQPGQASARKALSGYAFLWAYKDEIFPCYEFEEGEEDEESTLETTAMAMEDYSSALFENLVASEEVIASNMRDSTIASLPDSEIAALLRMPYYNNIGLPSFYVHQCLVELVKKSNTADSYDIYSQAESTQASTCLDMQIKRKKKESRRTRKVVGRRFDIYSKSQKAARNAIKDESSDVVDGESLTMGSLTRGVEDQSLSTYGSIRGGNEDSSQMTTDSRSINDHY